MRILIVTGSFAPETGGIAALVRGLAEGLLANGVSVQILAATPGSNKFSTPNLPVAEFDLPSYGYLRRIAACRRAVQAAITNQSFERILTSSWSPFAVHLPQKIGSRRLPLDILSHGMDLLEPARSLRYRLLLRRTLRRASRLIANSRFTARIAAELGARQEQVRVVPPGVDPARFSPGGRRVDLLKRHAIDFDAPILLSVGRLVPRKGFDLMLQALPRILSSYPRTIYLLAGDGPDRNRLQSLASSLGVQNSVRFAGIVPDEELPAYYQSSDVFVMPSRYIRQTGEVEGFGIVFLEAAGCERPVVGGNSGGIEDAVLHGETGYLIDPENADECAAAVSALLSDADLRHRLGFQARRRVIDHFQWPRIAALYLVTGS